ncbi:MAG: MATE family efflux transporter [Clostridiales bacterium]|jgi:putative MATE family efflux protein|nr:MATE family efflux transporter [Clostridiales bacterium]
MRLFVRDKNFYKSFFSLLVVISLQSLISLSVQLADNIMLGAYSETAMSGAALANQFHFLLQMVVSGIAAGIVVLGAQYWGKGETEPIRRIISVGMKFSLLAGLLFFAVMFFFPQQALRLLTNEQNVIDEGVKYMRILSVTCILFSVSNTLVMSLRSVETAFIGTVMAAVTLVVNISLNYCLIFGNLGFPELGIEGAAIATLASWMAELVIILIYVRIIDKKLKATLKSIFCFDFSYLNDYIKAALPIILSGSFWGVAMAAQTSILGHMGESAIAANSISAVVFQVVSVFAISGANASSVIMGKTVGEGSMSLVKPYSVTMQALFVLLGILTGIALFFVKDIVIGIYSVSEETRRLAINFMIVLAVTVVGTAYEYPVASGIIQGGGDTKYAFTVEMIFMWGFTIPISALSAFVFKLPPTVTFCCLKSDQILKCIPNAIRCNRYKWVRRLTRESGALTKPEPA